MDQRKHESAAGTAVRNHFCSFGVPKPHSKATLNGVAMHIRLLWPPLVLWGLAGQHGGGQT